MGLVLNPSGFETLQETYDLSTVDGVDFPASGVVITSPPSGKIIVLCLPLTDFQEELLRRNGCNIQMLTPNAVHKIVAFEMICRANDIILDFFFKYVFWFGAISDKYTFFARRGGHNLVSHSKTPKKWQEKWLWVNQELFGREHHQANTFSNVTPKRFPHNQVTVDFLRTLQVDVDEYSEVLLAGVGMSPSWRACGEMSVFFTVSNGNIGISLLPPPPFSFKINV